MTSIALANVAFPEITTLLTGWRIFCQLELCTIWLFPINFAFNIKKFFVNCDRMFVQQGFIPFILWKNLCKLYVEYMGPIIYFFDVQIKVQISFKT